MSADESLRRVEEGFSRRVSNVVPARAPSTALLLMELLLLLMEGGGSEERLRSAAARVEITRLPHILLHRLFLPARARLTAEARLTQLRLESRNLYSHSSMFCGF